MNNSDIYDAVSGIDEKYRVRSENFKEITAAFRRARIIKAEKIISLAASMVLVIFAGLNIHEKNDMLRQSSMINSSYTDIKHTVTAETESSTETVKSSQSEVSKTNDIDYSKVTTVSGNKIITYSRTTLYEENQEETIPGFQGTDTQYTPTAPVTSVPNENSVTSNPVSDTQGQVISKPEESNAPVPDTTAETDNDTSAVTSVPPLHWEEMEINEKFFGCDFKGIYYQSLNMRIDSAYTGEYLGEAEMNGYDLYTDTYYHCKAEAYRIGNKPETDFIAVKFEEDDRYFIYAGCS